MSDPVIFWLALLGGIAVLSVLALFVLYVAMTCFGWGEQHGEYLK